MRGRARAAWMACTLVVVFTASLGCAGTRPARRVEARAFLSDYARLEAGSGRAGHVTYRNPSAPLEAYDEILLEPVQIWRSPETEDLSIEDGRQFANRLYSLLHARLSRDFRMVSAPSRRTLRIEVAVTGALPWSAVPDTASTVPAHARGVAELTRLASGTPAFIGEASIEVRISDGQSGEVLMEGVDQRVGRRRTSGMTKLGARSTERSRPGRKGSPSHCAWSPSERAARSRSTTVGFARMRRSRMGE